MGTRSLTVIKEADGKEIVVMYRQMDGYIDGHGHDLAEFCEDIVIVNGIGVNKPRRIANGMACLAAQIVAHFKDGAGGFYLHPAGTRDCGEDYTYTVSQVPNDGKIDGEHTVHIGVESHGATVFDGSASELVDFKETE